MSWHETHRRWQIQRELEVALATSPTAPLVWRPDFADVFADTEELLGFLRYRWNLRLEAQLDPYLTDEALDERFAVLATARAGLAVLDMSAVETEDDPRAVA